jgi:hypothetical protein
MVATAVPVTLRAAAAEALAPWTNLLPEIISQIQF